MIDNITFVFLIIFLCWRYSHIFKYYYFIEEKFKSRSDNTLAIIIPIFGFDKDVKDNIPHYVGLAQSDLHVEWLFCLSWRDASAIDFIREEIKGINNCKVLLSTENKEVSDKNWNMLTGLKNTECNSIIFLDVDNRITNQFIRNFSELLQRFDSVTTFSHYYSNIFRSVWWSSDISDFLKNKPLYLWGGAMGFSLRNIPKQDIVNVLIQNIHDDIPLSNFIKHNNYSIYFDKDSFGLSNGYNHPESFYLWTLRLCIFGKQGLKKTWYFWLLGHIIKLFLLSYLIINNLLFFIISFIGFTSYYFAKHRLSYNLAKRNNELASYNFLLSVLSSMLMVVYEPIVNIHALFLNEIVYRKIKYKRKTSR